MSLTKYNQRDSIKVSLVIRNKRNNSSHRSQLNSAIGRICKSYTMLLSNVE